MIGRLLLAGVDGARDGGNVVGSWLSPYLSLTRQPAVAHDLVGCELDKQATQDAPRRTILITGDEISHLWADLPTCDGI